VFWFITWSVVLDAKIRECPICLAPLKFNSVYNHLFWVHLEMKTSKCWCGMYIGVNDMFTLFPQHLAERGGIVAHYLECQLENRT
jgi:hypothetical protein